MSFISKLYESFLSLVYPPLCIYCGDKNPSTRVPLCPTCLQDLVLLNPAERCRKCFEDLEGHAEEICLKCQFHPPPYENAAAAFDYHGPGGTLMRHYKYACQIKYSHGLAGFLAYQYHRLEWPLPDLMIPVPLSKIKTLTRGFNQSLLIAQALGEILNCSVKNVLMCRSGEFSQAKLNWKKRTQIKSEHFYVKEKDIEDLKGKNILIIDDVFTTGSTISQCSEVLSHYSIKKIFALAVCRA